MTRLWREICFHLECLEAWLTGVPVEFIKMKYGKEETFENDSTTD